MKSIKPSEYKKSEGSYPWLTGPVPWGWWDSFENQKRYFTWLGKHLGFAKPEDWYQATTKHFAHSLLRRYGHSAIRIIQTFIPNFDFKPWLFHQVPKGYWKDIQNQKSFFLWLGQQKGFKKPEDWYAADIRDFPAALLLEYKNEYKQIILTFLPEYPFKPWLFSHVPDGWWKVPENRKTYFDWLGKKLGFKKPEDWYTVRYDDFKGPFIKLYGHSPQKAVQTFFPDFDFKPWLFNRVPPHWWKKKENQKQYMEWLGKQLGFKKPEDWYKIRKSDLAPAFFKLYKDSRLLIVRTFFPNFDFKPWLFTLTPRGFWKDKELQKEYMLWLAKKLNFTKAEDWYQVKMEYFEKGILKEYGHSPYNIVRTFFPDYDFKPWLFKASPAGFWNKKSNHEVYFAWLGGKLDFKKPEDWYKIKVRHFAENGGAGLLAGKYGDSTYRFVQAMIPDYDFKFWLFDRVPVNFWRRRLHRRDFLDWFGKQIAIIKTEDWYHITANDFQRYGGGSLLTDYYNNSPAAAIMDLIPDFDWQIERFTDTLKRQAHVFRLAQQLYGKSNVRWNYRHPKLRFADTNSKMQFDIYVPSLKLAIEYQGPQHYEPIEHFGGERGLRTTQKRDNAKRAACSRHGIVLVEVPYTWDGRKITLRKMIAEHL